MLYTSTERSSFVAVPLALWLGIWPSLPISSWGLLAFVSRIWKFVVFTKIKDCSAWLSLKECILNNYVNIYTLFLQDLFFVSQLQLAPHNNPYPLHGQPVTFPLTDVIGKYTLRHILIPWKNCELCQRKRKHWGITGIGINCDKLLR